MKPFKQYYTEQQTLLENRRTFLRTLFGGAAAMAVSNPVRAANAVANAASAPWIKVSLEQDFSMYDYAKVSADEIAKLIAMKGKYTPGVSADGGITVNYNDSAVDMVEVYVKPGTPMYKQVAARISDDPDVDAPGGFDFEKQVFDTIGDDDGSGVSWLEDQLESMASQDYEEFKKLPQDMKDERRDVDGIDDSGYQPEAQMNASSRVKEFIDQAEEIGAELPDWMRDVVGRGYMKGHVLANASGNEEVSTDTLAELQDLYPGEHIDYPDEMDIDRWLDGTADNPMDSMGYDREEYSRDMDQVAGELEYKDQDDDIQSRDDSEMTTVTVPGYDSSADNWAEAGFNFLMGASQTMQQVPVKHVMNVPGFYDAIKKGREMNGDSEETDIDEPLTIAHDGSDTIEIIGGFAQLAAADDEKMPLRRVRMVHVDELQAEPESTSKYLDNENI